jgi:manganese/zinc/iron transport system ATP- binding protein
MIQQVEFPILEVHDLSVRYHNKTVLWNVDFTLPYGVLAGIIGPNGAGKSTLIKAIMGLIPVYSGYVKLFGEYLKKVKQRVAYIPQKEEVNWDFPITVKEVVEMGRFPYLGPYKKLTTQDHDIVAQAMERVGISTLANRQVSELSGGQQQRVFLARALAQDADIYFMDEPFTGIDIATEHAIISLLKDMKAQGKTIVVVHHDLYSAYDYFDWVVLLNGHLVASAPTEKAFTPELLQKTYGGKLTTLTKIAQIIKQSL